MKPTMHSIRQAQQEFREQVRCHGVQSRLDVSDAFGWWFAGYFDGEGHLGAFYRERTDGVQRALTIQLAARADDRRTLEYVHESLGIGAVYDRHSNENPSTEFRIGAIVDLAEIIVPLFDTYGLRTKKREEFRIWRELVLDQYILAVGGKYVRRTFASAEHNADFAYGVERLREIRRYKVDVQSNEGW